MSFTKTSPAAVHPRHWLFCQTVFSEVSHKNWTAFKHSEALCPCMPAHTQCLENRSEDCTTSQSGMEQQAYFNIVQALHSQAASSRSILIEPFPCWFLLLKEPESISKKENLGLFEHVNTLYFLWSHYFFRSALVSFCHFQLSCVRLCCFSTTLDLPTIAFW